MIYASLRTGNGQEILDVWAILAFDPRRSQRISYCWHVNQLQEVLGEEVLQLLKLKKIICNSALISLFAGRCFCDDHPGFTCSVLYDEALHNFTSDGVVLFILPEQLFSYVSLSSMSLHSNFILICPRLTFDDLYSHTSGFSISFIVLYGS